MELDHVLEEAINLRSKFTPTSCCSETVCLNKCGEFSLSVWMKCARQRRLAPSRNNMGQVNLHYWRIVAKVGCCSLDNNMITIIMVLEIWPIDERESIAVYLPTTHNCSNGAITFTHVSVIKPSNGFYFDLFIGRAIEILK